MTAPKPRRRACKQCKTLFHPPAPREEDGRTIYPMPWEKTYCSSACAAEWASENIQAVRETVAKAKSLEVKRAKRAAKVDTLAYWEGKHTEYLHKWVREVRDLNKPCVSCGRSWADEWHAGHFINAGNHAEIRHEPDNIHKQCSQCNTHLSGNLVPYREELIRRIGLERVEWLELNKGAHRTTKLPMQHHRELAEKYRMLCADKKR